MVEQQPFAAASGALTLTSNAAAAWCASSSKGDEGGAVSQARPPYSAPVCGRAPGGSAGAAPCLASGGLGSALAAARRRAKSEPGPRQPPPRTMSRPPLSSSSYSCGGARRAGRRRSPPSRRCRRERGGGARGTGGDRASTISTRLLGRRERAVAWEPPSPTDHGCSPSPHQEKLTGGVQVGRGITLLQRAVAAPPCPTSPSSPSSRLRIPRTRSSFSAVQ